MNLRNISNFTDNEYKQQAQHKNFSMIANIMSGVNFSSNKVLYTLYNENIHNFQKTETVANLTALKTDYHGGSSNLNGVIFNNIKDYSCGNNISVIDKKGDMGSRLDPTCAAPRYNFVRKDKSFDLLFKKDDTKIIPRYEFEGEYIEYKFMLFILPLLVINGNEGLGSGHAQKILPRNISEIAQYIKNSLLQKDNIELYPSYKDFNGVVEQRENINQWKISGIINRKTKTKTEIIEVPVNETYKSMIKKLDLLKDNKVIRDYDDLCDTREDKFYFIIKHDNFEDLSDTELLSKFKLIYNVTENYTVINEKNALVVFEDIYKLLDYYINIRLEYYQKRKDYLLQEMLNDLKILRNKRCFIESVNNKSIDITNKSKKELEATLYNLTLDKIDNSYDYLLSMKFYNITSEKIEELNKKISELEDRYNNYLNKDIKEIWIEEIDELLKALGIKKEVKKTRAKRNEKVELEPIEISDEGKKVLDDIDTKISSIMNMF